MHEDSMDPKYTLKKRQKPHVYGRHSKAVVLTIWPQQNCSSPQTSQQPAVATVGVQVELVCVTWFSDPLRLLHPDKHTHTQIASL